MDHCSHFTVAYQKKPSVRSNAVPLRQVMLITIPSQVFRRLARQLRSSIDLKHDERPAVPPKEIPPSLHIRAKPPAPLDFTPDWLSCPVNSRGSVEPRAPPLSPCPSTRSKGRRRTFSKAASLFNEGGKNRASLFKKSSAAELQRSDSVLSFASADAFSRSPMWDQDSGCYASPISPTSPFQQDAVMQRRTRSSSDSTMLPLASDFGGPQPRTQEFRKAHRPKTSDSSGDSMDTVESEILHITAQMESSALSAMRSRPSSIRMRRSFESSQRPTPNALGWI